MATTSPIILPIETPGLKKIKELERRMQAVEKQVNGLNRSLPRASNNIRGFGGAARRASSGFAMLNKAMVKVAAVIATLRGATFVFTSAAELESQAKSLEILTGSAEKAAEVISEIQDFSAVTPFTSSELIDTTKRLKAFGVETENLVKTTKMLADVSGATGAKINEVALAYGQVQAKGKLQTEELYQLQERGIGIADELKRMYGLTGEEFVKALEKGQISAKAVEQAFINLTGTSGKYFNGATAQSETLAGKWSTLIDAVTRLAQNLGQTLGPALKGILDLAINITNAIVGMIQKINALLGIGTENAIAKLKRDITDLEGRLGANNGRRDSIITSRIAQNKAELAELEAQFKKTAAAVEEVTKPYAGNLPPLLGADDDSGSGKTSELEKQRQKLEEQFEAGERIKQNQIRELELLAQATDFDRERVRRAHDLEDAIADIVKTAAPLQQQELIDRANLIAATRDVQAFNDKLAEMSQFVEEQSSMTQELGQEYQALANSIAGSMTDAFRSVIDGSKSAEEAFADMLKAMGSALIDYATQAIAQYIAIGIAKAFAGMGGGGSYEIPDAAIPKTSGINFAGAFADGGLVPPNSVALVGERGPELISTGSQPINVTSNEQSKAAMSRYSPSNDQTLKAGVENAPINVNYSGPTLNFNGDDYIPRSEAGALIKAGAKQGEAMTLSRLQNSRSSRQKLGM